MAIQEKHQQAGLLAIEAHRIVRVEIGDNFNVYSEQHEDLTPHSLKARCILAFLLLCEGLDSISRNRLAEMLWSRHAEEQAKTSLRQALSHLRRCFQAVELQPFTIGRHEIRIHRERFYVQRSLQSKKLPLVNLTSGEPLFERWLDNTRRTLNGGVREGSSAPPRLARQGADHSFGYLQPHEHYHLALANKVKNVWVDGVLRQSLEDTPQIAINLTEDRNHLHATWRSVLPDISVESHALAINDIYDVFKGYNQNLLILGDPGSGKTTLLLQLAETLFRQFEQGETQVFPVIFHLASWSGKQPSFEAFLLHELQERYNMPLKSSEAFLKSLNCVLLLDGLDEVNPELQESCISAMNAYQAQKEWVSLVVCSRTESINNNKVSLKTAGVVTVCPLSVSEVNRFLPKELRPLGSSPQYVNDTMTLLQTPLMLSMALKVFKQHSDAYPSITSHSQQIKQGDILAAYVDAQLSHTFQHVLSPPSDKAFHWLGCLAKIMEKTEQNVFHLDLAQPTWAPSATQAWLVGKGSVVLCGLIVGVALGVLCEFFFQNAYSLFIALTLGSIGGLSAGLLGYGDEIKPMTSTTLSWRTLGERFWLKLFGALFFTLIFGLGMWLLVSPLAGLLLGGLLFALVMLVNAIDTNPEYLASTLGRQPKPTIQRSFEYAITASLVAGGIGTLLSIPTQDFAFSMVSTTLTALIACLCFGGHVCIQHYLLRFFWWRANYAPLRYRRFLNYAVERKLLYRVGSGYMFTHRTLAEFFIHMITEQTSKV